MIVADGNGARAAYQIEAAPDRLQVRALRRRQAAAGQAVDDIGGIAIRGRGFEEHRARRRDRAKPEIAGRLHEIGAGRRAAVDDAAIDGAVDQRRPRGLDYQGIDVVQHRHAATGARHGADGAAGGIDLDRFADDDRGADIVGGSRIDVAGRGQIDTSLRRIAGDRRIDLDLIDRERAGRGDGDVVVDRNRRQGAAIDLDRQRRLRCRAEHADAAVGDQRDRCTGNQRIVHACPGRDRRIGAGCGERRHALQIVDRSVDHNAGVGRDVDRAGAAAVELNADPVGGLHGIGQRKRQAVIDLLVPGAVLEICAATGPAGRDGIGVERAGRGHDLLVVAGLELAIGAAIDDLLHVRNQARRLGVGIGRRIRRDAAEGPAIGRRIVGDRAGQRGGIDPLVILIGLRRVGHARRTAGAEQRRRLIAAGIDPVGLIGAHLLPAGRRGIVDIPGRLLLELIDDFHDARGTDAGVDRVGDQLIARGVVDGDRAGPAIDHDIALAGAVGRGADDLAVQVDIAAGSLHHAVQQHLIGQDIESRTDLHVAAVDRRQIGRQVEIIAVKRVGLGLGKRLHRRGAVEQAVDGVLGVASDIDRIVAALAALDGSIDVEHRSGQDDRLADGEGLVRGRVAGGIGRHGIDGLRLDIDDLEVVAAAGAVERAGIVARIGLPLKVVALPAGDGDLRRRCALGLRQGGDIVCGNAAIAEPVIVVGIAGRQEDRRIERATAVIQVEQPGGEDLAGVRVVGHGIVDDLAAIVAAIPIRKVRMGTPVAIDDGAAGTAIAVGAEIGRRRLDRGERVGRPILDARPLRRHIVVRVEYAADAAVEGEAAVRNLHFDRRRVEGLRSHHIAERIGDVEQAVQVGDGAVKIDVRRLGERGAVLVDALPGVGILAAVARIHGDHRRRARQVGLEGDAAGGGGGGAAGEVEVTAGYAGDGQVRQVDEVQALVLDVDRHRVARADEGRRRSGYGCPGQGLGQDRDVARGHQDVAEGKRRTGSVSGKRRLLDEGVDLALNIAGGIIGRRDGDRRRGARQRGLDLRRRQAAERDKLGDDRLIGIEAADHGVLDRLVIVAHHRVEQARVGDQFEAQRVGAGRRQGWRGGAERDGEGFLIVDAGHHHAVERDIAAAVGMTMVVVVFGAEGREIWIVIGSGAVGAHGALRGAEEHVVDAEHLRAAGECQVGIVLRRGGPLVFR